METLRKISYFGTAALLIYMPFHIFLTQYLSLYTGGLDKWKIAKDIFTAALVLFILVLAFVYKKFNNKVFNITLGLVSGYAFIHAVVFYLYPESAPPKIAALAFIYNNRLFWYLLIGIGTAQLIPKFKSQKIIKIILIVSSVVSALAILQFLLPKDLLENFGYSVSRGVKPAFFIDDKMDLPRAFSTLRDPNSLGAFLIMPLCILWQKLKQRKDLQNIGLFSLHMLALFLTFSRSAWLGAAVGLGFLFALRYKKQAPKGDKKFLGYVFIILTLVSVIYIARDQYFVQNVALHSDESTVLESSSEKHISLAITGIKGILNQPLGHGPGTAGLVAIQNPASGLLTENYFIQIGYEIGIIGLAVFLYANYFVYKRLSKQKNGLATILIASFWGYVVTNMLLHTWSNEAVAAQWWLLAGLALGSKSLESSAGNGGKAKNQQN